MDPHPPSAAAVATGFPRALRLRRPAEFKWVAIGGSRVSRAALAASYRQRPAGPARLGLAIAKKSVPHAVDRNRIKRLIREDFRRHCGELPAVDLVFHARPGLGALANAELRALLAQLRRQLSDRCSRAAASSP